MVVWEEDVAGGAPGWHEVTLDLGDRTPGKTTAMVGFRLLDKQGVSSSGVHWRLDDLRAEGLELTADLSHRSKWQVSRQGAFETR